MAQPLDHVTAPCSFTPYRDDLFGPEFSTTVFISEVDKNIIHREILVPDGVTFTSHRSPQDQEKEFLAATDNWFRPTQSKTGPDGALYIVDMYRLIIEHEEYYPTALRELLDFRAGDDKGRIYRLFPKGAKLRAIPRLNQLDTAGMVAALDSPNGWQRDTAQRLLVHARDTTAIDPLNQLVRHNARAKTRLQALCTLEGIQRLTPHVLVHALKDAHPAVRKHAIRVSESLLKEMDESVPSASDLVELQETLFETVDDPSVLVRYQLAFSLGEWSDPRVGAALAKLAVNDLDNHDIQVAVMSSAMGNLQQMFATLLSDDEWPPSGELMAQWLGLAAAVGDEKALHTALGAIANEFADRRGTWQFVAVSGLLDALERKNLSLVQFAQKASSELATAINGLEPLFQWARTVAGDDTRAEADRGMAIRLLGRGLSNQDVDLDRLIGLVSPGVPASLQQSAVDNLINRGDPKVAERLLGDWKAHGPQSRARIVDALAARAEWAAVLLGRIQRGEIASAEFSTTQQQKFLHHPETSIREQAEVLLGVLSPDRKNVLSEYAEVVHLIGNTVRGAELYRQHCATCHRRGTEGQLLGPDLDGLAEKQTATLLQSILDPNQAVEPDYVQYLVVTQAGLSRSGIVASETANSITLKIPETGEKTFLRTEIEQLRSTGLSLMPEGFEKVLGPPAMADLIAWLKSDVVEMSTP